MRLKNAGSWCERRDLNPHGCPPDPKSGASAIPPLSHSAGGSISGKQQYIHIFPLGKPKRPPKRPPPSPGNPPHRPGSPVAGAAAAGGGGSGAFRGGRGSADPLQGSGEGKDPPSGAV